MGSPLHGGQRCEQMRVLAGKQTSGQFGLRRAITGVTCLEQFERQFAAITFVTHMARTMDMAARSFAQELQEFKVLK